MKNLKKAEITVIALTLLCLVFTAGYFIGRGSSVHVISIDKLSDVSASVSPPGASVNAPGAPEETPGTSEEALLESGPGSGKAAASQETSAFSADISAASATETAAPTSGLPGSTLKVNINTASLQQLDALPGIGPVLAQSIVDFRTKNGGFKSIEQIMDVDGIGEKKYAAMKDMITVG